MAGGNRITGYIRAMQEPPVPYSPSWTGYTRAQRQGGKGLAHAVICDRDMEGIVAKQASARYTPEATTWVKTKNRQYSRRSGATTFSTAGDEEIAHFTLLKGSSKGIERPSCDGAPPEPAGR
jgi:hypothetical protein